MFVSLSWLDNLGLPAAGQYRTIFLSTLPRIGEMICLLGSEESTNPKRSFM